MVEENKNACGLPIYRCGNRYNTLVRKIKTKRKMQYIKTCNPQRKWDRPYSGKAEFLSLMIGAFVVALITYLTVIVATNI